jgi:L-cysteine:1D-myo-inositol 2-amino-2-deoxy-alpha-D-glucopyranoside ligase
MWYNSELDEASAFLDELRLCLSRPDVAPTDQIISEIIAALSQDLDTPKALVTLQDWITATNQGKTGGDAGELSRAIDALLGIAI